MLPQAHCDMHDTAQVAKVSRSLGYAVPILRFVVCAISGGPFSTHFSETAQGVEVHISPQNVPPPTGCAYSPNLACVAVFSTQVEQRVHGTLNFGCQFRASLLCEQFLASVNQYFKWGLAFHSGSAGSLCRYSIAAKSQYVGPARS